MIFVLQIAPVAAETINTVKDKVAEAAHAGIEKTQEVYNEYVAPTAAAGRESQIELVVDCFY